MVGTPCDSNLPASIVNDDDNFYGELCGTDCWFDHFNIEQQTMIIYHDIQVWQVDIEVVFMILWLSFVYYIGNMHVM